MSQRSQHAEAYDAVIIGGGFTGSAFATLLRQRLPAARILVIERQTQFENKVGEATVEVSGYFLHAILGLYDHLSRHHLPKHGLRFWFSDGQDRALAEMTEVGSHEMPRIPSFQLQRPVLDEHMLANARECGCDVWRTAKVISCDAEEQTEAPQTHRLRVQTATGMKEVTARWVIDASGRQSFLAQKKRLRQKVERHPTAAIWGRWQGVEDLDSLEWAGSEDAPLPAVTASRRLATNHFCGYGWWCWVIPQANGNTSIGLVYNKDLYSPPAGDSLRQRYLQFVTQTPGLRDLVASAEFDDKEFMALSQLPYKSKSYMGNGWALVGDAGAFIDPFYSPGLDFCAISLWATLDVVERSLAGDLMGEALDQEIHQHNKTFVRSYDRWLDALYEGKYELMGDADVLGCAYLMDTALYYSGVVTSVVRDRKTLAYPLFGPDIPPINMAYRFMRAYNQRLLGLARFRRQAGTYGSSNLGRRRLSKAFDLGVLSSLPFMARSVRLWLGLEFERLVYRLRHGRVDVSAPVPQPVSQEEPVTSLGN